MEAELGKGSVRAVKDTGMTYRTIAFPTWLLERAEQATKEQGTNVWDVCRNALEAVVIGDRSASANGRQEQECHSY